MKINLFTNISVLFFMALPSITFANRYDNEILLVRQSYHSFMDQANRRFEEMETYRSAWESVALEMKDLQGVILLTPKQGDILESITSQKVYLETVWNHLEQSRPYILDKIQEAESAALSLPELKEQHHQSKALVIESLALLENRTKTRLKTADENYERWRTTQLQKIIDHQIQAEKAFKNAIQVSEMIEQVGYLFTYLNLKAEKAIRRGKTDTAQDILAGMIWLRASMPLYFSDKITNQLQKNVLDAYLQTDKDRENILRQKLISSDSEHASLPTNPNGHIIAGLIDQFTKKIIPGANAREHGKEKSGGGGSKGGGKEKESKSATRNEFDKIKATAKNMDAGTKARGGSSRSVTLSDGTKVTERISWEATKQSVCNYNGTARVDIRGIKSTASSRAGDAVPIPSDGAIRSGVDRYLEKTIKGHIEVACKAPSSSRSGFGSPPPTQSNNPNPRSNPGPVTGGPSNSASPQSPSDHASKMETPKHLRDLVDREMARSPDHKDREDLSGLKNEISAWAHAQEVFSNLVDETIAGIIGTHQSIEGAANSIKADPLPLSEVANPGPALEAGMTDLSFASQSVGNYMLSPTHAVDPDLGHFMEGAAERSDEGDAQGALEALTASDEIAQAPSKPGYNPPARRISNRTLNRLENQINRSTRNQQALPPAQVKGALVDLSTIAKRERITPEELAGNTKSSNAVRQQTIDRVKSVMTGIARVGIGFTPLGAVVDLHDLMTGTDFFTGAALSPTERALSAAGVVLGMGTTLRSAHRILETAAPEAKALAKAAESLFFKEVRPVLGNKYVKDLPELEGSLKGAYDGHIFHGAAKPGEIMFQAQRAGQTKPGRWLTPVRPVNPVHAEELLNIKKWGNNAEKIKAYRIKESVSGYAGKVAGGDGHQFYVPENVPLEDVLEEIPLDEWLKELR